MYVSIRGQDKSRKAHLCGAVPTTSYEAEITPIEAEEMIIALSRFLLGPDSRLPFQIRAMVRREQLKAHANRERTP